MKIPIKKWVDDPTKTWKLRFNELKAHHEEETKWSLSRRIIMTNKLTQTEAALIAQKLFGPHGTAWVGRPEDNSSGVYNSYPGNQCMVGIITYVVKSFWFIKWKHRVVESIGYGLDWEQALLSGKEMWRYRLLKEAAAAKMTAQIRDW